MRIKFTNYIQCAQHPGGSGGRTATVKWKGCHPWGWSDQTFCVHRDPSSWSAFAKLSLLFENGNTETVLQDSFSLKTYEVLPTRGVWRKGHLVKGIIVPLEDFFSPKLGKKVTQDWLSSHSSFPTNHGKSQRDPSHTHQDAMFPSQVGVFMVLLEWSRHALRAAEPRGPQRSPRSPSCYCLSLLLA